MNRKFFNYMIWMLLFYCGQASAQLLPDNKTLNAQSVQRWMQTNREMAPVVQVIDTMNATEAALKAFESMSPVEQDQKINEVLKANNLLENANQVTQKYGWKSVGE